MNGSVSYLLGIEFEAYRMTRISVLLYGIYSISISVSTVSYHIVPVW